MYNYSIGYFGWDGGADIVMEHFSEISEDMLKSMVTEAVKEAKVKMEIPSEEEVKFTRLYDKVIEILQFKYGFKPLKIKATFFVDEFTEF